MISPFTPFKFRIRGQLIAFDKPVVMGILNVTPDSFHGASRIAPEDVVERAGVMLHQGAAILDVGGQSTRPGARDIGEDEEISRVIPAIRAIRRAFPEALISIDTFRGEVARRAADEGVSMINDVSAGSLDPSMLRAVQELALPYVLMHMQGTPATMQVAPVYHDILAELFLWFSGHIKELRATGVHDIILDPGFGFGKELSHNYTLLAGLSEFTRLEVPVLAGVSRKKMIQRVTGADVASCLPGTIAANTIALTQGASILRVHDVTEAVQTVAIWEETRKAALGRF